jgi:hypothetical protein
LIASVSLLASPTSHGEIAGSATDAASGAIIPSSGPGEAGTTGGVVSVGMNSSTVRLVTESVCDPLMIGPSW